MSKIKGKDLLKLGFKKVIEEHTLDPDDNGYHYYTYDINKHCMLISCANDEKKNGGYYVELYEIAKLKFKKLGQLKKLISILKSAK